jgi:hypothetical protein
VNPYEVRGVVDVTILATDSVTDYRGVYEILSDKWTGDIKVNQYPTAKTPYVIVNTTSGKCNVTFEFDKYSSPPTEGNWFRGVTRLVNKNPGTNDWYRAECTKSGVGANAKWQTYQLVAVAVLPQDKK